MNKYMVVAKVAGKNWMVGVDANSVCAAEHMILDAGVCGRHEYAVEAAQAFGSDDMKTDYFVTCALLANTTSFDEIMKLINERNKQIVAKDEAEDLIRNNEKQIEILMKQIEEARKVLNA